MIKIVPSKLDNLNPPPMKWTSTLPGNLKKSILVLISIIAITLLNTKSYAQTKSYAITAPSSGLVGYYTLLGIPRVNTNPGSDAGAVTSPGNAADDTNLTNYATLTAKYNSILGLATGEGEAWLQLKFPSSIAAGKTSYIRFDQPTGGGGLSLDLLAIVGDLTGLLKQNIVQLDAYSGANSGSDGTLIASNKVISTVVKDQAGNSYFAVTSTDSYNSIRVRLRVRNNLLSLALGASIDMKVYSAFTVASENCAPSIFTNIGESAGLNVSLTQLLLNPEKAIDGSTSTYSTLQSGLVGLGSSVSQTIYLNGLSGTNDYAKVLLSKPGSLLSVDLAKTITVQAYNGNVPVGTPSSLNNLLTLDLLGLLSNTSPVPVFFKPGAPFDRIKISIDNALAVGGNILSGGLNIHEAYQTVEKPLFAGLTNGAASVCGNQVALSVTSPNGGYTYNWYRSTNGSNNKVLLAGASGSTYSESNLAAGTYTYYLSAQKAGCAGESDLDSAKITVTAIPALPTIATVAPICSGSTATLNVSNPVTGVTYKWYSTETGTTALATGNSYTTAALTTNTTYYVEGVSGTCVSPTRAQVSVTIVTPPSLAAITTNNEVISSGQSTILRATADAGNTIKWYATANSTTALATGANFTTPALTATTTYYVGTENAQGCTSTSRVPVIVTVIPVATGLACNAATSQQSGIDGLCLLCGISDAAASTDTDPNTFTGINLAVGVGASGYQRLIFANKGVATDSIRLDLGIPGGLADVGLLSSSTVTVFDGVDVVNTYPLNSSLLNLVLLGGNRVNVTVPAGGVYDRVEIRFGGVVTALTTYNVYGATIIYPNPTIAATGQAICSGSTTTLTATANGGTTLKWYASAASGTALATGNTFTTPALTATTTYYIEVTKGSCANAQRVPVLVTVNPTITFATTALANAAVNSVYSKQITAATGGTPAFTYALASGSTLPAGLSLSATGTISGTPTAIGDFTFSIIATDSKGCNATAAYALKVNAALALADATLPNGTVGTIYPPQTIPTATGGTGPYVYVATNLPPGLTFDPATHVISGTPTQAGTFTVPVIVTDANGNTVTKDYTIIVRDPLLLPTAVLADGTVGTLYPTQIIPSATGGQGPYTYAATGIPAGLTFDPATRQITGTPTASGTFTIPVTVTDADGKTKTTNYTIKVVDPLALAPKILADGTAGVVYATQTIPAATGGTGPYTYTAANLPAGLTFDAATREIKGTPTASGTSSVSVTAKDATGKTVTQAYSIKVNGILVLPGATLPNGLVGTTYPEQTLPAVSGGTSPYTYAATGVPAGLTFDPLTRKISGTPTLGGSYTIKLTATDNAGISTSTDYALLVNVGQPVVAGVTTCNGTTATLTVSNTLPGVTYNWYAATGNTSIASGSSFTTPALTATTTYYVEAVSGTAVSSRTAVTVTINPAPALASILTANENISSGQTATLRASTTEAGSTIKWYVAASGGAALATGANFTTPVLTATTTYYVGTESAQGCASTSRVPVTVTVTPISTGISCNAATSQQSGIDGLCLLCGVSDAAASTDTNPNNFTGINLAVGVGATGYQRLIFANKGVATDSIRLDLGIPTGLADVGVLSSTTVTVFNGTTVVSTYPLNSSLLNLVLLSGSRVNVTVPAGGVYDRVEIRFGALISALTTYNVYGATVIYPNPTVATTGQAICSGSTTTLTATANGGTTLKWYASATSGTALATGNTFTTPALTANTTYYIEVAKGTCANAQRVPVLVTINPAITFATTVLTNAAVNSVYSKQITAATGGTPAFTYALASGSTLPAGLSLSATGAISGTPTAIGDFTFSIIATDSKGCNATAAYTLKVTAALALADATLPNGTVGTIYPPQTIPAATGGTGPYVYTATSLPPGLTFTPGTRVISGTPTQAGTFTVPVTVTDANGNTVTKDYTIIVRDPLVLPTAVLADGTVGTLYPTQIIPSATGGQGPYTYVATGIPAGLTFDPATRQITGTPTASGTFTIPVTVTDADGKTKTTNYTIKVVDPLALAPKVLADGNVGVVYATQTIPAATGGTGPYTYTAANLPAGLTFDAATREIKGTPTASGTKNVSVTAKDAAGRTVTQTYSIKVNGILVLPGATLPNGLVGTVYAEQTLPAVSGGTSPYTYAATGVPAGLTFDPLTRKISGTPTTGGSFTIKLTATDNTGISTSTDYALLVNVGQPVVAGITTCHGTAATLTVSNTLPGVTYNWYAATGSTSIASGSSFTTPALAATTTYYVEAVSGTAVSSRTAVTVTINPAPALASILTANENISSGQTATLRASTTEAGSTIKWYAAATGGAAVSTGANFTTPVLTATTTYYVGTESAQGCASTSRVPVTVTVTSGPVNPNCNAATSQQSGIDGLCLLCGISDAGASTDANANNFTGINLAVGVGATGYQRLIFANQGSAADSIRLDLGIPTGLADVGVLSSTTVTVFNGTTVVSTYPLNSSLLNLVLLGGNRVNVTVPAGGVYDRVEIRFGALISALTTYNVYGATIIYPNPTVATTGQAICSGSTTTLTATANGGTTLRWYASATSGTALATGNTFTTPALTANTTYYIEVTKGSCANAQRVPVLVTVNPTINFATTVLTNAAVNSAYSKQITAATGGTPAFTYALASGSTLPAGLSLSATGAISGTPTAIGDFTFSIIATDSKGCNATAAYALKVNAALALADAILPNGTVGTIYPPQTIPAATGGTGPYVYTATNLPPGLTFTPGTRVISGTPTQAGTFTVPVTVTDANGNTVTKDYTIIVRDPLVLPTAVLADGTVGTLYPTQIIPSATGGQGPYTYAATGIPAGLTFDSATRQITGTPTTSGTFTIPVTVTDADGKTKTTNYTIKVVDPLALAPKVLADGNVGVVYATQTIPAATGGTGPYTYTAANLPAGLTFDAATREIKGTPTASGTSSVSLTAKDAAGRTVTQTYSIKVNGILVLPGATLPNGLVGTVYAEQTLPAVSGGTSPYTYAATGVPAGLSFDPLTRKISGTPTLGGSYTIKLTATDNVGISTSTDYALLVNVGQPVVAGVTTCNGTTATLTVSNTLPGVTYNWYAATGNTSIASGSSFTTPALTATTTYYVEAVSGTAVSSRTAVTVTINPAPALASILTANENISSGQTATLRASTTEAGSTIKWYAAATGGAALATGANFTTPVLTATTTYYVGTESAQGCASTSRVPVTVTVTTGPVNPNCNAATSQQSGIDGLCLLCGISDAGASTDANANNFTGIHLAVGVGAQGYQKLIFGKTGSATDSIRLDLGIPTGLADVGVLAGTTVTVLNGSGVVSTYPLNSSLLNLVLLSGSRVNVTVPAGGVYDRVEIRFGALITALTTYNVYGATIIYPNPTVAATGQTICSGSATTLTATANGGTTLKWYASATSGTVLATGNTFTTPALTATTTYYIEVSKDGCANVERIPVTVTVTTTPANPTVATVAPICSGSAAIITVTAPVNGVTYKWYAAANGGASLFTGSSFTTPALTASATYYVEASAGSCTSTTRTAVAVTVNTLPALATVTTNNSTISAGQTATLAATAPAGITIKWYSEPTGGVALAQGASYTTAPLSATTTYYVETSNTSGCVSATRVPVTVTVLGGPVNPNCNAANSQQSGIEGICVLCTIQNAGNSIDNNFTNFTTISLPVGVGGSGYQRLIFANSGVATDSIRLDLETPGGLADVTLLGGIKVTVMNGTSVVNTYNLQSSLLNLTLLSGKRFTATLPAGGVYDRVEIRAEGLANVLVNLNIYGATIVYPNPTVSAAGQTICSGSATVLSAAANGGTTLRWYSAATNGTLLHTGENFTTPVLNATTTYYIEVSKGSCANVTRIPVTVKVTTAPGLPTVAAVAPVCSGSTAVISVTAPVAGTDYNWYTTATGGTAIFTGSTFTTPVLTSGTTYYVEAANGNCVSATRVAVSVTVNPLPALPQISASATTVNVGQTAVLTGTSTDANVTFNWYTSANSTTPVYTGPTYVTPPLTVTTTYFLEAKNASGCTASARAQVTITVNGGGPNPIACEAPTTQENGVDGVALLAGVFNPLLAIDNDAKTGSSLVMPVGLLGASVYQRVGFTTLSNVGDTVRVSISAPGKLLSVGLLSNIMIGTYNGNASNGDGVSLNDQLVRIELLSGNTEALVTFVPTKKFNKIEVRLNSGLAGVLSTVDFNYAQRVVVAPVVTAQNVTICANQTATLAVQTPLPGITYKWYNEAGAYQTGKDGATFTTPALSANTKFYVEAVTASGCTSYRTSINVIVTPAPTTPVLVNATINSCVGNQVTIEVSNPLVGVTYKWYDGNGVYQTGKDGVTFTTTVGAAQTTYSVEAATSCGISGKATATIKVGTLNPPVITPAAVTISSGSPAVLVATSSTAGAVFKWYSDATLATLVHTGAQYTTAALDNTTNAPIIKTFYVTVETTGAGACPASAAASVNVTILPKPIPGAIPCQAATVAIKDGVDGVAVLSAVFNPGFAVDNNSESGSSFVMPVGALGASVYQQVGFTGGLSSVGDTLRLRISSPGKLLSLTVLSSIEVTTLNNGASNNDMLVISNPIVDVQILSSGSEAIITYVPQKQFDGVELRLRSGLASVLTTLDFNYAQRILVAPSVQSATATACTGTSANLFVKNPVTGLTYKWFMRNGQTITYLTGKDGVSLATDPTLAAGTYDFYVAAVNGAIDCLSAKTKITVTILAAPDAPVAATGNPATTCPNTSATLAVNPVASVTFNWYDAATGGNLLASNTNTYTTPATLAVGTHDFYVEAVNGNSCVNTTPRTKITLTINPSAVAADINVAGANAPFCAGTSAKLTATSTTVTNPVFTWYSDAALTDAVFTGAIFNTPLLTGTTTYYVSVTGSNKCANTAADAKMVTVTVNPPATAADLDVTGGSEPFCAGAKVELTATTTTVTSPIFNWYSDAALTKLVFTGDRFVIPSLAATTTYYVTVSGSNKCENLASNAEIVTLTVNPPAIASDINVTGNQAPFCAGAKATLSATSATVLSPVFTWYSDAALTDVVFTGATFITPVLTATKTYYVTVRGSNKCENTAATAKTVTVTVNPPATAADINVAGADAPYCAGTKAKLVATTTTVTAPIFNWYSDAALTKLVFTGATFETPALSVTTTYYVTVAGSNRCENTAATAKTVTVTVNPPALATDINVAGADAPFCSGNKARLVATSTTVTNPVFTWYSDAALTTAVFTGPVFNTPALTATTTYYVTVRGSNKCENGTGDAKIITLTVNPPATAADIIVKGADSPFCAGTTATLDASSTTVTNPVFTWYSDAALTNAVFTGAKFVTPVLTATTKYYVTVRGDNKCENLAASAKVVTVTINPPATAADLSVTGNSAPLCAGATATLTATSTTVTNPKFTWYSDAALTDVVFTGSIFKTPVLTATTTYYVTVRGDNRCETLAADAKVVTVTVNPPATAADINVAGNNAPSCAGTKATLVASSTTITNPVFTWYSDAALTTVVFTGTSFETPVLTATTTYYVTVRGDNKCENTAATAKTVTVTVNPPATAADINVDGATDPLCSGTAAKLTATSITVTNPIFTWYSDAALTNAVFTGSVFNTPLLTATTNYYVTVKGDNRCDNLAASAKVVTVVVNPPASAADITVSGAGAPICAGTSAALTASTTTVTNPVFTWYSDAALTNVVSTGPAFTTPLLTVTTNYYVTVRGDNKCENLAASAKVVTITVNPLPNTPEVASAGTNICSGESTVLSVSNAETGILYQWYSEATGGILLFTGEQFTTATLTTNTDYYVLAVSAAGCGNATGRVKVTVTVSPKPLTPVVVSAVVDACVGSSATLSVSNPQTNGVTYKWYTTATGGTAVGTGTTFTTPAITGMATYYVEASTASCVSTGRTAVKVNASPIPTAPTAIEGVDGPLCSGTTATLSVTNPDAALTYSWFTVATGGTSIAQGVTFTTPALTTTTTYYVESSNATGCTSTTRKSVVVTVLSKLDAPVVTVKENKATEITFQWNPIPGATAYEVSLDNGVTWVSPTAGPTGTTHLVAGLKPDQSVTIRVRAKGQLDCQLSDATSLTAKSDNPLGNTIFVPNTFTPNNDGKNDVLYVYGNTIAKMKLRVYNQWGQFIYESLNIQNGWDGTYKGDVQPNGVYVYFLEAEFNDGTKTTKKGTITLLR